MPGIDLYAVHGLDRRQPPEALAAQLTAQLNTTDPRDILSRNRIDTARAILADPARRARYDAALADKSAPPLDEAALAAIAGRTVPGGNPVHRSPLAEPKVKILASIAGALAVLLAIAIAIVSCGESSDGTPTSSPTSGATSPSSERQSESSSPASSPPSSGVPYDPYPAEQEARIGDTVVVDGYFRYQLTGLTKVNNPTPQCPGTYFALATTVESRDNNSGSTYPIKVVTGDSAGNLNHQRTVDGAPLQCGAETIVHFTGPATPVTSYIRIKGLDNPTVLYIRSDTGGRPNSPLFVTIPENLR